MSTHKVEIVKLPKIGKHPSADSLGIVHIWGYSVVVRFSDWKEGDLAAYIEPDYVVDVRREEFSFLRKKEDRHLERVTVKRLRGIHSQGLLIPAPEGAKEGDDVREQLGVERYVPSVDPAITRGGAEKGPEGWFPKYDLEPWRKHRKVLEPGEEVVITEKIHGASAKFKWEDERMYCGSRTQWKKEDANNIWWDCLEQNPWIQVMCKHYPSYTFYGEVYGWVQSLRYGHEKGKYSFAVFDVLENGKWVDFKEILALRSEGIETVPVLYIGPYSEDVVEKYTDGNTHVDMKDRHIREGCVIQPMCERTCIEIGRVKLKNVSNEYLERVK